MKLKIVQLIKTSGILHPPTEGGVSKDQNENRPVQENRYCGITTAVFAHGAPSPLCVISITRSAPLRKGKRSRSEEHTSELQSLMRISYAVFCLKKKKNTNNS